MFTGIIVDVGQLVTIQGQPEQGLRLGIATSLQQRDLSLGASVACDGVCLTVTELEQHQGHKVFYADVSPETLRVTTLGVTQIGQAINLEPALRLGDSMGGHQVTGHVDAIGKVVAIDPVTTQHTVWSFSAPPALMRFIATRGSIAVNGTSLTVIAVDQSTFSVNLVPHTVENTSFAKIALGMPVNLEVDVVARYVARATEFTS